MKEKMSDEIIAGLRACAHYVAKCEECPYDRDGKLDDGCCVRLYNDAADLIEYQQAMMKIWGEA